MSGSTPTAGSAIYLLDSSVLILSMRGDQPIRDRLAAASKLYVPSIALGELYDGAYGSPTRPVGATADVTALATANTVLGTDADTALIYGRIKHELKVKGLRMPDNDLWIAAISIQYDVTLAARDTHFNWIDGLRVEQW